MKTRCEDRGCGLFLGDIDCDRLVHETFRGNCEQWIEHAIHEISAIVNPHESLAAELPRLAVAAK